MKLSIGMYIRTKSGEIAKIIAESPYWVNIDKFKKDGITLRMVRKVDILKESHNIIDLIEEDDYIRIITSAYFDHIYYSYGKLVIRDDVSIENYSNDFIAEVITHEQMKNMAYKVVE